MSAILDWYGCATFRLVLDDLVVFLDAYIDRVPGAPGTGLRADDVERADWIVVGHSHFDHLWGAAHEFLAAIFGPNPVEKTRRVLPIRGLHVVSIGKLPLPAEFNEFFPEIVRRHGLG